MNCKKILVLMGGTSTEREISLKSGEAVARGLRDAGYIVEALDVLPDNISKIKEINPDVAYLALHGRGGEDGCIQGLLEWMGIPYTGPGVCASAICMDKAITKKVLLQSNIPTPKSMEFKRDECADVNAVKTRLLEGLGLPMVIKAPCQGSSIGVVIVKSEDAVEDAVNEVFKYDTTLLAEQFIDGTEVTIPIIGNENPEALPIIEITAENEFYDFQSKYTPGMSSHIIPARISKETEEKIIEYAKKAYIQTGCKGISRVDFMVDKNGEPYVIEINTIPGMTKTSLVPDSARYAGISFSELVDKIVNLAVE